MTKKLHASGYWVEVPALSGCFSQGETVDETLASVRAAIKLHLEGLKEEGQEIPRDLGSSLVGLKSLRLRKARWPGEETHLPLAGDGRCGDLGSQSVVRASHKTAVMGLHHPLPSRERGRAIA